MLPGLRYKNYKLRYKILIIHNNSPRRKCKTYKHITKQRKTKFNTYYKFMQNKYLTKTFLKRDDVFFANGVCSETNEVVCLSEEVEIFVVSWDQLQ